MNTRSLSSDGIVVSQAANEAKAIAEVHATSCSLSMSRILRKAQLDGGEMNIEGVAEIDVAILSTHTENGQIATNASALGG